MATTTTDPQVEPGAAPVSGPDYRPRHVRAGEAATDAPTVDPEPDSFRDRGERWLTRFRGVRPLTLSADLLAGVLSYALVQPRVERAALFTLLLVALFINGKLYRSRLNLSILDDLPQILGRWIIASAISGAFVLVLPPYGGEITTIADNPGVLAFPLVSLALVLLGRAAAYTIIRRARATRRVGHRTLIIGAGTVGEQIATILRTHPEFGLNPVGFLDPNGSGDAAGLPVLGGTPDQLDTLLLEHRVHIVIVAFSRVRERDLVRMIRACDRLQAELFVVPRLYEVSQVEGDMDNVWGVPLLRLRRSAYRSVFWPVKRIFDIVCSSLALMVLGIPMALIALAVRVDSGPGVIFIQDRVGVDGRALRVMKFRTMKPASEREAQTHWNIKKDDRITPLGRFLRQTSLDELPQLINILRGEMSIVGPRPERPHFVNQFQQRYPAYDARHRVPCGLTGLAAIHGLRGDTSIEERARWDNYYIQNWSLWLDVKIIARTVVSVVKATGNA